MAFEYKSFLTNKGISSTKEKLIHNTVVGEQLFLRFLHLHNTDDTDTVTVDIYLIPNVATAEGTWSAFSRIYTATLQPRESIDLEFAVPGIVLDYNDKVEFQSDVTDRCAVTLTGGRNY